MAATSRIIRSLAAAALMLGAGSLLAQTVTPSEQARQLMDYGENVLPGFFPGHEATGTFGPILYRFYPSTGIYLGVVVTANPTYTLNGVYVMGGSFGGAPRYVGQLTQFVTPVDPVRYILDSFGQIVAGGADGVGTGDSGADGTAGDGAPIVGATVVVTDANGRSVSAVTDTTGHYRVKVTGFTPPFVARVTKPDGSKIYTSLNVAPTRTNAYVTMNISGLTDKISSDVARAGGKTRATELTPQIVAANTGVIATSVENLKTQLAPVLSSAGISATSFDPIGAQSHELRLRAGQHGDNDRRGRLDAGRRVSDVQSELRRYLESGHCHGQRQRAAGQRAGQQRPDPGATPGGNFRQPRPAVRRALLRLHGHRQRQQHSHHERQYGLPDHHQQLQLYQLPGLRDLRRGNDGALHDEREHHIERQIRGAAAGASDRQQQRHVPVSAHELSATSPRRDSGPAGAW